MKNKKGFTLLELLVVVLIIGILASIALPQYTRAVEKAKLSEALTTLKSIENSLYRLMYENDDTEDMDITFDMLDIELPNQLPDQYTTDNFEYIIFGDGISNNNFTSVEAIRTNGSYGLTELYNVNGNGKTQSLYYCYTYNTQVGEYICDMLRNQGWWYCESTQSCGPPHEEEGD